MTVVLPINLGRTDYVATLELQRRLHAARVNGQCGDVLLLTEHEPVLTLGRKADDRHVRVSRTALREREIPLIATERGGDVTYHGPGQIVAYPILDLRPRRCDVHAYVHCLEETAIRLLGCYGLEAHREAGRPGVWVAERKIASVGVYVSRWATMHGVAINIAPRLEDFELIDPCGLTDVRMTSIAELLHQAPSVEAAAERFACIFADVFGVTLLTAASARIDELLGPSPHRLSDRGSACV